MITAARLIQDAAPAILPILEEILRRNPDILIKHTPFGRDTDLLAAWPIIAKKLSGLVPAGIMDALLRGKRIFRAARPHLKGLYRVARDESFGDSNFGSIPTTVFNQKYITPKVERPPMAVVSAPSSNVAFGLTATMPAAKKRKPRKSKTVI